MSRDVCAENIFHYCAFLIVWSLVLFASLPLVVLYFVRLGGEGMQRFVLSIGEGLLNSSFYQRKYLERFCAMASVHQDEVYIFPISVNGIVLLRFDESNLYRKCFTKMRDSLD